MARGQTQYQRARAETIRYHSELYSTTDLGTPGTWLAAPQRSVLDAIALVESTDPVVAYDLGAGIGRHTIPMLERLAAGSTVFAVDLLPDALSRLRGNAPAGAVELVTIAADLHDFEFELPANLVVAFSAIEHLPDLRSVQRLLRRIVLAVAEGGIAHFGFVCDRVEVEGDAVRPAILESGLTADQARDAIHATFSTRPGPRCPLPSSVTDGRTSSVPSSSL